MDNKMEENGIISTGNWPRTRYFMKNYPENRDPAKKMPRGRLKIYARGYFQTVEGHFPSGRGLRVIFHEIPSPRPNFLFNAQFSKSFKTIIFENGMSKTGYFRKYPAGGVLYNIITCWQGNFENTRGISWNNTPFFRVLSGLLGVKYIYMYRKLAEDEAFYEIMPGKSRFGGEIAQKIAEGAGPKPRF